MPVNATILVIDDSPSIHALVGVRLKDLEVKLLTADNGQDGLEQARNAEPDLILLDVNMPGMDGFDVIRELKSDADTYNIPVIFLSGMEETAGKVKGFDLGAVDYVTKPFEAAELRARVRAALKTKKLMDLLTSQAMLDGLTGLHNRRYFDRHLSQTLNNSAEAAEPVGLILLDIDHFKSINDSLGHPKGDQLLQAVAQTIQPICRKQDVACRYGGEEFAVILELTNIDESFSVAERIRGSIESSDRIATILGRKLTISSGVAAVHPPQRISPEELIELADQALYQAKEGGRNQCRRADQPNQPPHRHPQAA